MAKPIVQIKIEGPAGSGKLLLMLAMKQKLEALDYKVKMPASSYDPDASVHAESDTHIVQIRTRQTRKKKANV